jgi:transcriptional regulator with XRE-family HTH domain
MAARTGRKSTFLKSVSIDIYTIFNAVIVLNLNTLSSTFFMDYNIFMKQSVKTPAASTEFAAGERIAKLRKLHGLTQEELAAKMGINRSTIANYEAGRLRIYASMLKRFALALRVTSDELLGLSPPKNDTAVNLKTLKRLNAIEKLPARQKTSLLNTIDTYLKSDK